MRRRSEGAEGGMPTSPPLLALDAGQQAAAAQLTHHLNNILSMVAEHFTSLQGLKVGVVTNFFNKINKINSNSALKLPWTNIHSVSVETYSKQTS